MLYPRDRHLYKFKPCAVTDVVVHYAPSGPSFYRDTQAPTMVVLSINLLEVEYWIRENIESTWDKSSAPGESLDVFVPAGTTIGPGASNVVGGALGTVTRNPKVGARRPRSPRPSPSSTSTRRAASRMDDDRNH
jgi:hypothetical protein